MAFLVTDANDIKKHVALELLNLQLGNVLAKRPLVESLGSVMATPREHETRFDVTQDKRFEKLGRIYVVDEILMSF